MGKITKQAGELDDNMQEFVKPPITTNEVVRDENVDSGRRGQFGVRIADKDRHDKLFELKKAALEGKILPKQAAGAPLPTVPLTDEDMQYIKRKQETLELAKYNKWLTRRFDLSDPNTRARLANTGMLDDYFQSRERVIDELYDTAKDLQKMRLYGPRSKKDVLTCFAIQSGRMKVPQHLLKGVEQEYEEKPEAVRRGLFNLKSFYKNTWAGIGIEKDDPLASIFGKTVFDSREDRDLNEYSTVGDYREIFDTLNGQVPT
jgi:hypothetical protein